MMLKDYHKSLRQTTVTQENISCTLCIHTHTHTHTHIYIYTHTRDQRNGSNGQ